ncbi:MAG: diacylglycerol kinase family protein [Bacteroidales bacterium]|nr:diacylglycerol kinase family protein [Bacteroidales bacterium]
MIDWIKSRTDSFRHAFAGIWHNLRNEPNFRFHVIFAFLVTAASIYFPLTSIQWIFVAIAISSVLSAELLNTAVEKLCDRFTMDEDPDVKIIKDTAAAGVIIVTIAAVITGLIIFLPYVIEWFQNHFTGS